MDYTETYRREYIGRLKEDIAYNNRAMQILKPGSPVWKAYSQENKANREEIQIMEALIASEKESEECLRQ